MYMRLIIKLLTLYKYLSKKVFDMMPLEGSGNLITLLDGHLAFELDSLMKEYISQVLNNR